MRKQYIKNGVKNFLYETLLDYKIRVAGVELIDGILRDRQAIDATIVLLRHVMTDARFETTSDIFLKDMLTSTV